MLVLGTLTPQHGHILPAVFSSSTWKTGGVWMWKLGLEVTTVTIKVVCTERRRTLDLD